GRKTSLTCPDSLLFDWRLGRCRQAAKVACPEAALRCGRVNSSKQVAARTRRAWSARVTTGAPVCPDAFYPAPGCAQFVLCVAGNAREFACPSDLIFSRKQLACDYANKLSCRPIGDVKCTFAEEYADAECVGRPDGVYPGTTADTFYACLGHVKVATSSCPEGSVFDPTIHGCQTTGPVSANDGVSYGQYECEGRIGVFPDYRTSCYSYRICADGLEVVQDCGGGLSYDTEFGRCVEDASTPCRPPRVVGTFKYVDMI
ncbi:hypothetical protein MTO96_037745, partial [Rhipicephalus appendiculatus]